MHPPRHGRLTDYQPSPNPLAAAVEAVVWAWRAPWSLWVVTELPICWRSQWLAKLGAVAGSCHCCRRPLRLFFEATRRRDRQAHPRDSRHSWTADVPWMRPHLWFAKGQGCELHAAVAAAAAAVAAAVGRHCHSFWSALWNRASALLALARICWLPMFWRPFLRLFLRPSSPPRVWLPTTWCAAAHLARA